MAGSLDGRFGLMPSEWVGFWWVASYRWWSLRVTLRRFAGTRDCQRPTGEVVTVWRWTFWRFSREVDAARRLASARTVR